MARQRDVAALAAAAVVVAAASVIVAAVTAPIAPHPPRGLEENERLPAYESTLDLQWAAVTDQFPDAVRPPSVPVAILSWEEQESKLIDCFNERGANATVMDGGYGFEQGELDPEAFAVVQFACNSLYVDERALDYQLSEDENQAMYDYYVEFVRPCLASVGAKAAPPPPARDRFDLQDGSYWHPYLGVWDNGYAPESVLEKRCPPEPPWSPFLR